MVLIPEPKALFLFFVGLCKCGPVRISVECSLLLKLFKYCLWHGSVNKNHSGCKILKQEAKAAAKYITDTNNNDGVAKAIKKLVFGLED